MEIKDKVELNNGEEVEVIIKRPGYHARNDVFRAAIQTGMTAGAPSGSFDMFRLQSETIKRFVKPVIANSISSNPDDDTAIYCLSGDKIFQKYFSEAFNMGDASGNLNETSEE